jgi:adenylate kinase family enzyme
LDISKYKRIILVGNNGSGKSFFSKELAKITGLPLIHLDNEYWQPCWQALPRDEWEERQRQLISGDEWIVDGNYTGTMELRFERAELIIFLDVNRIVCLMGVLKRRGKKRTDIPDYLDERLDKGFFRMCAGLWRFAKKRRPAIMSLHEKYPDKAFWIIKGRRKMRLPLKA